MTDWQDCTNKTLIKYINGTNKRFIVIGDLHGSFATFVRILLRLKIMNIMDDKCKLLENYNIIFLGDVVDRGVYGYEIVILIFILKIINPDSVFYNRGNHEELETNSNYGLLEHNVVQFNNDFIHKIINNCFNYSHSAILIYNEKTEKYIYLAHGGLPLTPNGELYKGWIKKENSIINNDDISSNSNSIRWSDFHGGQNNEPSPRGAGYVIGQNIINEAKQNNIELIIRAHQDSQSNTKILRKNKDYKYFQNIDKETNISCSDFIHKLHIDNNEIYINDNEYKDYLPVIVLTTNTDNGRDLNHDSFAILTFDNNDFNTVRDCKKDEK
jgi:hypothetical protein